MNTVTLIRIVAGALALVVLGIIIYRRKKNTAD
jgi:LPXTG-motif cell wall-anchored protein